MWLAIFLHYKNLLTKIKNVIDKCRRRYHRKNDWTYISTGSKYYRSWRAP